MLMCVRFTEIMNLVLWGIGLWLLGFMSHVKNVVDGVSIRYFQVV